MNQSFFEEMFKMMAKMPSETGMGIAGLSGDQGSLANLTEQQKEAMIKMWLSSGKNCLTMIYPFGYPTMAKTFLKPILWLNEMTNTLDPKEISDVYLLLAIAEGAGKETLPFMPVDISEGVRKVEGRIKGLVGEKEREEKK